MKKHQKTDSRERPAERMRLMSENNNAYKNTSVQIKKVFDNANEGAFGQEDAMSKALPVPSVSLRTKRSQTCAESICNILWTI